MPLKPQRDRTGGIVPESLKRSRLTLRGAGKKEIDTGMTPRSDEQLDFTTFGGLSEIIKQNWDIFGGMFSSVKAVERIMSNLNSLNLSR
jgi:hypothetical protein